MNDETTDSESVKRYADLSAFQRDALAVLERLERTEEDSYGLAVKGRLEERYDEPVNHGRLYPNLDKLVDWGLVDRGQIDQRTNEYTLTADGRRLLREHRDEMTDLLGDS